MRIFNNKRFWYIVDWLVIIGATITLICNLTPSKYSYLNDSLCFLAGVIGLCYLSTSIVIFFCNRPKFDWHLVNGNYLMKVVALVLLFPSIISTGFLLYNHCNKIESEYSPKNLVYDENLYSDNDCETDSLGVAKYDYLTDIVFLNAHGLKLHSDSIITQKNKLPSLIKDKQEDPSIFWTVYYHFIDPGNQHMTTSKNGRGWSALIAILGVFLLNGLLVSSIIGWIDSRKEKWLKGEVKYPCFLRRRKHYVIIGGNNLSISIVKQIFDKHESSETNLSQTPYILIQTSRDIEEFRRELFSTLTLRQQLFVIIYYGSRTSRIDLEHLGLNNTEEIYILGEETRTEGIEPYHDTFNMQCLDYITYIRNKTQDSKKINCYVMFEYQTTFAAFQTSKQKRQIEGNITFIPFSTHETWVQKVLVKGYAKASDSEYIKYNNIDRNGISATSEEFVHVVIVGMSKIGTAMAVETAHVAHFPNFIKNSSKRTKITFIDKNAREESEFFIGRFSDLFKLCKWTDVDGCVHNEKYPGYIKSDKGLVSIKNEYSYFNQNFIDIEFEFREGGVETKSNRDFLKRSIEDKNAIVTVAICLPLPHEGIAAALYLPHEIIEKANDIWVYQPQSGRLLLDITKQQVDLKYWDEVKYKKLKPFGMLDGGFDENLINNTMIHHCEKFHKIKEYIEKEVKEYDKWTCNTVSEKYKESHIPPENREIWDAWSNIFHLNMLHYKIRSISEEGKDLTEQIEKNKELIAQVEHNRWNVEKLLMGYRPLRDRTFDDEDLNHISDYLSDSSLEELTKVVKEVVKENLSKNNYEKITKDATERLKKKVAEELKEAAEELKEAAAEEVKNILEKEVSVKESNISEEEVTEKVAKNVKEALKNILEEHLKKIWKERVKQVYNEKDIYHSIKKIKRYYSKGPQKIHPNICPYDDAYLPNIDKDYDRCFALAIPFLKAETDNKNDRPTDN